jgi:hypothetical protein
MKGIQYRKQSKISKNKRKNSLMTRFEMAKKSEVYVGIPIFIYGKMP